MFSQVIWLHTSRSVDVIIILTVNCNTLNYRSIDNISTLIIGESLITF